MISQRHFFEWSWNLGRVGWRPIAGVCRVEFVSGCAGRRAAGVDGSFCVVDVRVPSSFRAPLMLLQISERHVRSIADTTRTRQWIEWIGACTQLGLISGSILFSGPRRTDHPHRSYAVGRKTSTLPLASRFCGPGVCDLACQALPRSSAHASIIANLPRRQTAHLQICVSGYEEVFACCSVCRPRARVALVDGICPACGIQAAAEWSVMSEPLPVPDSDREGARTSDGRPRAIATQTDAGNRQLGRRRVLRSARDGCSVVSRSGPDARVRRKLAACGLIRSAPGVCRDNSVARVGGAASVCAQEGGGCRDRRRSAGFR